MKASTYYAKTQFQLSPTSTTVASQALPNEASACLIGVETFDVRVTFDGTAPTSSTGLYIPKSQPPQFFPVGSGQTIKVISNAAGTAVVTVQPLG